MNKKIISIILALIMVAGVISIPAMAEGIYHKTEKYKITFDSFAEGKIGGTPNSYVNGGKEASMWEGFYMKDEINSSIESFYFARGATYNGGATTKLVPRDTNDYAIEFTAKDSAELTLQMDYCGYGLNIAPSSQTDSVINFAFDIKRSDMTANWIYRINTNTGGWQYDILTLTTDGKIKFLGTDASTYSINNWYNIDIYYDVATGKWYLYIDDTAVATATRSTDFTYLERIRTICKSPNGSATVYYLDNLIINEYTHSAALPGDFTQPAITLDAPEDGIDIIYGSQETVTVKATPTVYDKVERVSFYVDDVLKSTVIKAPYEYVWQVPDTSGTHTFKAVVTDCYFQTAASGVATVDVITDVAPYVTLTSPLDSSAYEYGVDEFVTLAATTSSYYPVADVSFYVNDELVGSDNSAPYECTWAVPNLSGEYKIKAKVTDTYPLTAYSSEISVNVTANVAPTVEFSGIGSENDIYLDEDFSFTVIPADADGTITKTEIYLNNEKYDTFVGESKDYIMNFDTNGRFILKAVTYDNKAYKGSAECVVNVLKSSATDVADVNFEDYSVGKTFTLTETIPNKTFTGNAVSFNGDMGKKEIAADGTNKYLSVGVSAESTGGSSQPYMAAEYFVSNAVISYETDIYFDRNDIGHNANFRGEDKNGGAIHMWALSFTNAGEVKVYNGGANTAIGTYSADTWYRLKIKLDIPNKKYDITLTNKADETDKCEAIGFNFTDPNFYKLQHIRIVGSYTSDNPGFIGYDNLKMGYTADYPAVSGFTDNLGTVGGVAPDAASITCNLTQPVGDITPDDIILENEYGKVTVASVSANGDKLIITPKDGFVSSAEYKLTILSTAPLADGTEMGFDTVAYTQTAPKALDVTSGLFNSASGGIVFTADIANTTGSSKSVILVTATYLGDTLVNVYSKTVSASGGSVSSDPIAQSASFDNVKAFVINDWSSGIPLSAKVFSFNQ